MGAPRLIEPVTTPYPEPGASIPDRSSNFGPSPVIIDRATTNDGYLLQEVGKFSEQVWGVSTSVVKAVVRNLPRGCHNTVIVSEDFAR